MHRLLRTFVLLSVIAPLSARAAETVVVKRGTAGLVAVPFTARDLGPAAIACSASLAHWYSADLGTAPPGGSLRATLWSDPGDGTVFLLNGLQDRMPVLTLSCGGAEIALERKAGVPQPAIEVVCAPGCR